MKEQYVQIGYITMCSLSAFFGFFLKETAGLPMEETIKEIEQEEVEAGTVMLLKDKNCS